MNIKNIFVGALMAISTISCNSWFDVSPSTNIKAEDLFKNEQGFRDALTAVYQLMVTSDLYGKELTYGFNDVRADYWDLGNSTSHEYYYVDRYDYTEATQENKINTIWRHMYMGINNLNVALEYLEETTAFSEVKKSSIRAEALALRAFLHFDILRLFAPSPAVDINAPAIPYYSEESIAAQPQLTVKEVLAKVRADLKLSLENFANIEQEFDRIRFNEDATKLLLARVELYAGDKAAALAIIEEMDILELSLTDATPEEANKLMPTEILLMFNVIQLEDNTEFMFMASGDVTGYADEYLKLTIQDKNVLYPVGPSDVEYREALWLISPDGDETFTLSKYFDMEHVPVLKMAELFLIAAECESDNVKALEYLNKIRAARGLVALENDVNLDLAGEIELEYKREFLGEGQLFYFFKRLNYDMIGIHNSKSIEVGQYTLPIPVGEQEFGNMIKSNE